MTVKFLKIDTYDIICLPAKAIISGPMKRPEKAPSIEDIFKSVQPENLNRLFSRRNFTVLPTVDGKYLHWSELKYKKPPEGLDRKLWWLKIKMARDHSRKKVLLKDASGVHFSFCIPDSVLETLHKIDGQAAGRITTPDQVTNPETRDRYIVNSLIEEAINSSQLEGASTSRKIASNMLRSGRKPKSQDEQMILNNYEAMNFVREVKDEKLTPELILELHKIVTDQTLDNTDAAGRLQTSDEERVGVYDVRSGRRLHTPPPASQLHNRLEELCKFANEEHVDSNFLHPIVKAIILHFWIGFDHPFEDGNGRLARALFYWWALKQNYWLFEFISISRNIKKAPAQYGYAYLYSETDENDLTYFIVHQLKVIMSSIADLGKYLDKKIEQVRSLENKLKNAGQFNHRQLALLSHAIRGNNDGYTFRSHQTSHNIVRATARADLLYLEEHGLLVKGGRKGRAIVFYPAEDIDKIIDDLSD